MNYFAKNLKYLRKEHNLSQEEFARKIGLNRGNIASYEKGIAEPNMKNLSRIGNFFNIELSELIEEDLVLKNSVMDKMEGMNESENIGNSQVQEILMESLQDHRKKIEQFRKRSDDMASILEGFKQFHKFRMENSEKLSDDVKKMALDYEKLLEVLEEVLSTNKNIIKLLET